MDAVISVKHAENSRRRTSIFLIAGTNSVTKLFCFVGAVFWKQRSMNYVCQLSVAACQPDLHTNNRFVLPGSLQKIW